MQTGNYKKCGKLENAVSISIGTPKYFTGEHATELKPTWSMVKSGYSYEEYVEFLKKRNVKAVDVLKKYKDKIVLCYEDEREKCHRGYLARWIKEECNVDVEEYESGSKKKNILSNIKQLGLF